MGASISGQIMRLTRCAIRFLMPENADHAMREKDAP